MIKRFIHYYKPYKALLTLDITSAMLIATLDLVSPRFTNYLISSIIPSQQLSSLYRWIGIIALVFIARVLLQYVVEYWGHVLGVHMEYDMRKDMYAHIQRLPVSYFDNIKVGKLMSRLVNDLNEISELAHHGPEDLLVSMVLLLGSFILMFNANFKLALLMAILVPLMIFVGVKQNLKFRKAFRVMRENLAEINARVEDNFSGIRVVKAFNAEESEEAYFALGNEMFATSRKGALKVMAEFGVSVKFFVSLITLSVMFFGGYLVIQGEMSIGSLVEFILYVQLFQQPITKISSLIMMYNQAMAGFERFVSVMEVAIQKDWDDSQEMTLKQAHIEFKDVSFQYGEAEHPHVLKSLNLEIKPGSKVAFVGPSGGGKSTLCNLIPRFYEVSSGQILIDGQDIRSYKLKSLRDHVGIVQQEVFIFAGTIAQNIQFGDFEADEVAIIEAAKKAMAWDFIQALPQGLHTPIGERGVKLSGGQRQRLALARIFLKNPPILILDEATSALDNITEKEIQATLDTLALNRTTLVVAHRLSTITDADTIVVLTKNGIEECGTHEQLMMNNGLYARLTLSEKIQEENLIDS